MSNELDIDRLWSEAAEAESGSGSSTGPTTRQTLGQSATPGQEKVTSFINDVVAPQAGLDRIAPDMSSMGTPPDIHDVMMSAAIRVHDDPEIDKALQSMMAPDELLREAAKYQLGKEQEKYLNEADWYRSRLAAAKSVGTELFRSIGDVINRGQFLVAGQADAFVDDFRGVPGEDALDRTKEHYRRAGRALFRAAPTPENEQYSWIDILEKAGVENPVGRFIGGLALDIVTDPTTWISAGATKVGKAKAALSAIGEGMDAVKGVSTGFKKANVARKIVQAKNAWEDLPVAVRAWRRFFGTVDPADALRVIARNQGVKTSGRKISEIVLDQGFKLEFFNRADDLAGAIRAGESGLAFAGRAAPGFVRKGEAAVVDLVRGRIGGFLGETKLGRLIGDALAPDYLIKKGLPDAGDYLKLVQDEKLQRGRLTEVVWKEAKEHFINMPKDQQKVLLRLLQDPELMEIAVRTDLPADVAAKFQKALESGEGVAKLAGKNTTIGDWLAKQTKIIAGSVDNALEDIPEFAEHAAQVNQIVRARAKELQKVAFNDEFLKVAFNNDSVMIGRWKKLQKHTYQLVEGKNTKGARDLRELIIDFTMGHGRNTGSAEAAAVEAFTTYRNSMLESLIKARKKWGIQYVEDFSKMARMSEDEIAKFWDAYTIFRERMQTGASWKVQKQYITFDQVIENYVAHMKKSDSLGTASGLIGALKSQLDSLHSNSNETRKIIGRIEELNNRFGDGFFVDDIAKIYYTSAASDIKIKTVDDMLQHIAGHTDEVAGAGKGWVMDYPKDGKFDRSLWAAGSSLELPKSLIESKLRNKLVRKEIVDDLKQVYRFAASKDNAWQEVQKYIAKATSWWKAQSIMPWAKSHIRNKPDDMMRNWVSGVDPARYLDAVETQYKFMHKGVDFELPADVLGKKRLASEVVENYAKRGGFEASQFEAEINKLVGKRMPVAQKAGERVWNHVKRGADFLLNDVNPMSRDSIMQSAGRTVWKWSEDNSRLAHFMDRIMKGYSYDEAMESVYKVLFNYDDIPHTVKMARKYTFPFMTFFYKNVPFVVSNMIMNPGKFATMEKLAATKRKLAVADPEYKKGRFTFNLNAPETSTYDRRAAPDAVYEEGRWVYNEHTPMLERLMPEWLRDRAPIPVRRDKKTGKWTFFMFENFLSATDIAKFADPNRWGDIFFEQMTPLIRVPIELSVNKDFWHRKPIRKHQQSETLSDLDQPWYETLGNTVKDPETDQFMSLPAVPVNWIHILKSIRTFNEIDRLTRDDLGTREKVMRAFIGNMYGVDPAEQEGYHAQNVMNKLRDLQRDYFACAYRSARNEDKRFEISKEFEAHTKAIDEGSFNGDSHAELADWMMAYQTFQKRVGEKPDPEAERVLKLIEKLGGAGRVILPTPEERFELHGVKTKQE